MWCQISPVLRLPAIALCTAILASCLSDNPDQPGASIPPASFQQYLASPGLPMLPELPLGKSANLELLDAPEREVVSAADARAAQIRSRDIELWIDQPNTEVTVTQVRHEFTFGFPIELKRFTNLSQDDLDWYTARMKEHFTLAVLESDAKWARVEPSPGERQFGESDLNVDWAEENGIATKGHTLLWGIPMPLSSAALPKWAEDMFPSTSLTTAERETLRGMLKAFIQDSIAHHKGRLAYWDVTNESLQPLAQWFIDRLGPGIVNDAFHWAREADPDVTLVFNEWIVEVFTGFVAPTASDVRDRVLQLLADGVPIDALGQQAHFAPTLSFALPNYSIEGRTPIDEYAEALDILAETGLPIHLTETNFISPPEPELRAAQAEALMRLWWGHPSVEMVVFWGPWNKVAGRDEFDVGFWDDDRNVTRHGAAVFSLINDRWRTRATVMPGPDGQFSLRATYGDYIAHWTVEGTTYNAEFSVRKDEDTAGIALVTPDEPGG